MQKKHTLCPGEEEEDIVSVERGQVETLENLWREHSESLMQ